MWRCFCTWEYTLGHYWHQYEKLCFESSQIVTVTKCDKSESLPSHCVICRISWSWPWRHKLSPITPKTCSGYLGEYQCSLLTWIWKVTFLPIFCVISLLYLFVYMYISYKAHNQYTQEAILIGSYVDVNLFSALRSIPSVITDINLKSCILNRHKLRQSQIATIQESLPSLFVICRNLWSRPWPHKLSPITLKTCSGYMGEYPGSLSTWIRKVVFLLILMLCHWYICLCVCISVVKLIIDVPRKSSWKVPILL